MSLYNGPPRPGARGGRDQFNWESVKSDKDREYYLGHSVKATTGRWQKGKDVFWYTREKEDGGVDPRNDEIAMVKQREEELMMEALGMKPKTIRPKAKPQLDQLEMKKLMEGHPGDQQGEEEEKERDDADRAKGLGFKTGQIFGSGDAEREVMAGVGLNRMNPNPSFQPRQEEGNNLPKPPSISASDLKKLRKAQEKDAKKSAKKAEKKAKKEAKKAKKEKKEDRALKRKKREAESDQSSDSDIDEPRKRSKQENSLYLPNSPQSLRDKSIRQEERSDTDRSQVREKNRKGRQERPEELSEDRHGRHNRDFRERDREERERGRDHRDRKYQDSYHRRSPQHRSRYQESRSPSPRHHHRESNKKDRQRY